MKMRGLNKRSMSGRQIARVGEMNRRNAAQGRQRAGIVGSGMAMTAVLMAFSFMSCWWGRIFGGTSDNKTTASVPKRPCLACGQKTGHPNGCCSAKHFAQWIEHLGPGRGYGRVVKPMYVV